MTNFGLQCNVTKYVTVANLQQQWRIKSGSFHIRRISIKTQLTKNSDHAYVDVFKNDKRNICEIPLSPLVAQIIQYECGVVEDTKHFFLTCYRFRNMRQKFLNKVSTFCQPTLDVILYDSTELSVEENKQIFLAVQDFVLKSKRF